MITIQDKDLRDDDSLFDFLVKTYSDNKDVLIPKDMLKDFVQIGCRITICKGVFQKSI